MGSFGMLMEGLGDDPEAAMSQAGPDGGGPSQQSIQSYHDGMRQYVRQHLSLPLQSAQDAKNILDMIKYIFDRFDSMWTLFSADPEPTAASGAAGRNKLLTATWLFAHVLKLLGAPGCQEIQAHVVSLLQLMLQIVHRRNATFREVVTEVFTLSFDLYVAAEYSEPMQVVCFEQIKSEDDGLRGVVIETTDRRHCLTIAHLLLEILPQRVMLLAGWQVDYWLFVTKGLEITADYKLTRACLQHVARLLGQEVQCPSSFAPRIVRALVGLLLKLCGGGFPKQNFAALVSECFRLLPGAPWCEPLFFTHLLRPVAAHVSQLVHLEAEGLAAAVLNCIIDLCQIAVSNSHRVTPTAAQDLGLVAEAVVRLEGGLSDRLHVIQTLLDCPWNPSRQCSVAGSSKRRRIDPPGDLCGVLSERFVKAPPEGLAARLRLGCSALKAMPTGQAGLDRTEGKFWDAVATAVEQAALATATASDGGAATALFRELHLLGHAMARAGTDVGRARDLAALVAWLPWLVSHPRRKLLPHATLERLAQKLPPACFKCNREVLAAELEGCFLLLATTLTRDSVPAAATLFLAALAEAPTAPAAVLALPQLCRFEEVRGAASPWLARLLDALLGLVRSPPLPPQRAIATALGPLACALAGGDVPLYPPTSPGDGPNPASAPPGASCDAATTTTPTSGTMDVSEDAPPPQEPLLLPEASLARVAALLQLLESPDRAVRLSLAQRMRDVMVLIDRRLNLFGEVLARFLALLKDPDVEVRRTLAAQLPLVLRDNPPEDTGASHPLPVKLREVLALAHERGDAALHETLLQTLCSIGRATDGRMLLFAVTALLSSMSSDRPADVRASAFERLVDIARHKNVAGEVLLQPFLRDISHFVVERMLCERRPVPLRAIASFLGHKDENQFLRSTLKYTLPYLVLRHQDVGQLATLAARLGTSVQTMLIDNDQYVFVGLLLAGSKEAMGRALEFFQAQTANAFQISELFRSHWYDILNQVVLHLDDAGTDEPSPTAISGLKLAMQIMYGWNDMTLAELQAKLQPTLLSILLFLRCRLQQRGPHTLHARTEALHGLIGFINTVGQTNLAACRVKVVATLKLTLATPSLACLSCRAWRSFVRGLDDAALAAVFLQVSVTMLPLFETEPGLAAEVYEHLIVDRRAVLRDQFKELHYLPDHPALQRVRDVLQAERREDQELGAQLELAAKGIEHESLQVRLQALDKLRGLLAASSAQVLDLILASTDSLDPLLARMFASLLDGCRSTSPVARARSAECVGYLGAVDPGRFQQSTLLEGKAEHRLQDGLKDPLQFSQLISLHLVRAFVSAENAKAQDRAAVAIQKCLDSYGCEAHFPVEGYSRPHAKMSQAEEFWYGLDQGVRDIAHPYLSTNYNLDLRARDELQKPVFTSHGAFSFKEWISDWACDLIHQLSALAPESLETRLFQACLGVVRDDVQTCLFLIPYICTNIVTANSMAAAVKLENELRAVLCVAGDPAARQRATDGEKTRMAAQTVFSVVEHMSRTLKTLQRCIVLAKSSRRHRSDPAWQQQARTLTVFLRTIPHQSVADAAYHCQSYERALLYFEQALRASASDPEQPFAPVLERTQSTFLQQIHAQLQELDGMIGVGTMRGETSLKEQILDCRAGGKWSEALGLYERALQLSPDDLPSHKGFVECLMKLGHPETATTHIMGIIMRHPAWEAELNDLRLEPAWRLADWEGLRKSLSIPGSDSFQRVLGQLFCDVWQRDAAAFRTDMDRARAIVVSPLSAVSMEAGSYQRGYQHLLQLQILREVHEAFGGILLGPGAAQGQGVDGDALRRSVAGVAEWGRWLEVTQPSFAVRETVLSVRRASLALLSHLAGPGLAAHTELDVEQQLSTSWLASAKIARTSQLLPTARSAILQAQSYRGLELAMETAHVRWDSGHRHEALLSLQSAIAKLGRQERGSKEHARALLMVGKWMTETSRFQSQDVIRQYKEVISAAPSWEQGYFFLAKYYDSVLEFGSQDNKPDKTSREASMLPHILENYGSSLRHGSLFIYEALPRLLTLWLQYGARLPDTTSKKSVERLEKGDKRTLEKLNASMAKLIEELPTFQFLTALPQLTSRICHPNNAVFGLLERILVKLLNKYPQQTLWSLMSVAESTHTFRKKRCENIFRDRQVAQRLKNTIATFKELTTRLLALSNKSAPRSVSHISLSKDFAKLKRSTPLKVILPVTSAMTVLLPGEGTDASEHSAFPDSLPTIKAFEEKVQLLPSLQRPKKIKILGSDGRTYIFLCKPKDDLRKDCRLMEFHSLINRLLQKDPDARRRKLRIRTYAVVPLNEECGLVEWVSDTLCFRNIVQDIYKAKDLYVRGAQVKQIMTAKYAPKLDLKTVFVKKLLPKFPPVFSEWFVSTFAEPTRWYSSRLAYARACAVMSMVGYVVGLGDRHGENILFDATTGECVHVDFNCLFCKGEQFDTPERVPFRLTRNMVDAFGVTGYEGVFRKTCEQTLRVMRSECTSLINVLTTFIYDPLVEWSSGRSKSSTTSSGEFQNEQAKDTLKALENRLLGQDKIKGLPLSIEGQVHHLIQEATSIDNLHQMYLGWAPHL